MWFTKQKEKGANLCFCDSENKQKNIKRWLLFVYVTQKTKTKQNKT